jgi:hypothetical protein
LRTTIGFGYSICETVNGAHHPQIEQVRFGITDDELLFLDRIYSYSTRKWVLAPFGESSPMYMSDPMKLGAEWMSFYQNPPHGHPYIEGKEASMTPEEIRKAWEPFRDRFDFRNMDGKLRSIPLESQVGTYFSTNSERLVAVDGVDRSARRSAYEESMRIAETPENFGAQGGDVRLLQRRVVFVERRGGRRPVSSGAAYGLRHQRSRPRRDMGS